MPIQQRYVRAWRQVVVPIDQLMPFPIIGKQQEVLVGELHAGRCLHIVTPCHALIVARTVARAGPQEVVAENRGLGKRDVLRVGKRCAVFGAMRGQNPRPTWDGFFARGAVTSGPPPGGGEEGGRRIPLGQWDPASRDNSAPCRGWPCTGERRRGCFRAPGWTSSLCP